MKRYKILFSLLLLVTACNFYIFFNRDGYVYIKQSSYFELYRKTGNPSIHSFGNINDSTLSIKLNHPPAAAIAWGVMRDDGGTIRTNQIEPTIALKQGVSTYTIFSNSLPETIAIKAEYYPTGYFKKDGNSQPAGMVIYKAPLPSSVYAYNDEQWSGNKSLVSPEDKAALEIILKDSIQIKPTDNAFEKIRKTANFLHQKIFRSRGTPTDVTMALPAFQQYKAAVAGQRIWCGNYAQIFNLFATAAHVKNRYVEIRQSYGGIAGGTHVFNEYYLPQQKKWAAIDILFNNVAYKDAAGNFLNAVEVKNTDAANGSVWVLQSSGKGSLISIPFTNMETVFFDLYGPTKDLYFYHDINLKSIYTFKEKMRRYCSKAYWFQIYSDTAIADNRPFYIKQLFLLMEMMLLLVLLLSVPLKFFTKKQWGNSKKLPELKT